MSIIAFPVIIAMLKSKAKGPEKLVTQSTSNNNLKTFKMKVQDVAKKTTEIGDQSKTKVSKA